MWKIIGGILAILLLAYLGVSFGLIGLVLVQGFHAPALYRMWKKYQQGSTLADVSIPAYSILLVGLVSYAIYGISEGATYYVWGSCLGAAQVGATLWLLQKARF